MLDVQTLAPHAAAMTDDNVQVWLYSFQSVRRRLADFRLHLSEDECGRADRFYFARDRERYTCWRGVLRELLAYYTGHHAGSVRFSYGEFGKPVLATGSQTLRFNVSHSGDRAIFAFSRNRSVGVDIERVEEDFDFLGIALEYLSARERRLLERLGSKDRLVEFYRCWTRREAYLKGVGSGLPGLTQTLEITEGVNVVRAGGNQEWRVQALDAGANYCASVAVEGSTAYSLTLHEIQPIPSL